MIQPAVALIFTYPPQVFGGFNESVSLLEDASLAVSQAGARPIVFSSNKDAIPQLLERGYSVQFARPTAWDRAREVADSVGVRNLRPTRRRPWHSVEEQLRSTGVRAAIFLSPSWWGGALATLPFGTTVWDVGHLDEPSLREIREFGESERRERFLQRALRRAEFTVVPDEHVRDRLVQLGYLTPERVIIRPFSPPKPQLESSPLRDPVKRALADPRPLAFYPAYYWPHKGHEPLLQAIAKLGDTAPHLVLTGGDRAEQLRQLVRQIGVDSSVTVLGQLTPDEVDATYRRSNVVVMPTLLGPSNLPPLEAWAHEVPLVYSTQFASFAQGAAAYAEPTSCLELANAILRALDPAESRQLVRAGRELLAQRASVRSGSQAALAAAILRMLQLG